MDLKEIRNEIDAIDSQLVELFEKRMDTVRKVAEYKLENNMPIFNSKREQELHPPLAVPRLKTRTSRPQGGQSQHRARARCAPASRLCFSDALRGVIRRKKPARVTEYPNGLKTS